MPFLRRRRSAPRAELEPRCNFLVLVAEPPALTDAVNPEGSGGAVVGYPARGETGSDPEFDRLDSPLELEETYWLMSPGHAMVELHVFEDTTPQDDRVPDRVMWRASGIDEEIAQAIRAARYALALALRMTGDSVPDAVNFATMVAERLAEAGDGVVRDIEAYRFFAPGGWQVDDRVGDADPREHIVVHSVSEDGGPAWIHTHGLVKFGRPEFEIYDVPPDIVEAVGIGILDMAAYVMGGALVEAGQTLGDPDVPIRARRGGRDREHWEDTPVLELVGEAGLRAWLAG